MSDDQEDLIESDEPSPTMRKVRRRLDLLIPATVGRRVLAVVTAIALALGLAAGYLVGHPRGDGADLATRLSTETGVARDLNNIPFVPEVQIEDGVLVYDLAVALLTVEDLAALGEQPLPSGFQIATGLAGLCSDPQTDPSPGGSVIEDTAVGGVTYDLADGALSEVISADLDILAASTLSGQVQLAQDCSNGSSRTVETEGVLSGIGDEYAAFTVHRTDPASGAVTTSYVVLVRQGGQLIEVTLTSDTGVVLPDGMVRAIRIAEAAVTRMLTG